MPIPNQILRHLERAKEFWNNMSRIHRIIAIAGVTILLAAVIGITVSINHTEYKVLYSNLSPEDAARVVKSLQADKIAYKLVDNGATVEVPQDIVYEQRIRIAGEGGLVGQGIGFEIFDKLKVGQTDFVQKINYMRALQGELARTISEFPSVESARIHLVTPKRSLFIEQQQPPSASVVLKLKNAGQKPDQKEISAIVNMMLMSVEGLDKAHLSISDSSGKVLYQPEEDSITGITSNQMEHRLRIQRDLERRIEEMLQPVFGPGRVIAKVNADMDFSQRTIRRELFDPEKTVVRSEQRSEESQQGTANLESGTPDANFRGDGINGSVSNQNGSRETRTTNYEINKEEQNIVSNVGDISRLSVAVILDGTYKKIDDKWTFVPRTAEELARVQQLVSNAVGLDKKRGDSLEVSSIPFNDSTPPETPNMAELLSRYAERLGKPFLNALLAFLFIMLIVRPVILALIRPKVETGEMVEGLEGLPAAEEQIALYEELEEAAQNEESQARQLLEEAELKDVEALKASIFSLADQHMDQVVILMRGWMTAEEKPAAS